MTSAPAPTGRNTAHSAAQFGGTGSSRARQRLIFRCRDHGGLGD
jgi:ligand-binding sensor protein